jgi:hypothetical protein
LSSKTRPASVVSWKLPNDGAADEAPVAGMSAGLVVVCSQPAGGDSRTRYAAPPGRAVRALKVKSPEGPVVAVVIGWLLEALSSCTVHPARPSSEGSRRPEPFLSSKTVPLMLSCEALPKSLPAAGAAGVTVTV